MRLSELLARAHEDDGSFGRRRHLGCRQNTNLALRLVQSEWLHLRMTLIQRMSGALPFSRTAMHGVHILVPNLPIPRCGDGCAGASVAAEDDGAVLHDRYLIRALHRLTTRKPAEAGNVPCCILFGSPHIHEIDRLVGAACHKFLQAVGIQVANAVLFCEAVRVGLCGRDAIL